MVITKIGKTSERAKRARRMMNEVIYLPQAWFLLHCANFCVCLFCFFSRFFGWWRFGTPAAASTEAELTSVLSLSLSLSSVLHTLSFWWKIHPRRKRIFFFRWTRGVGGKREWERVWSSACRRFSTTILSLRLSALFPHSASFIHSLAALFLTLCAHALCGAASAGVAVSAALFEFRFQLASQFLPRLVRSSQFPEFVHFSSKKEALLSPPTYFLPSFWDQLLSQQQQL